MDLYEKNGNILYILNVLKKYSDEEHLLTAAEVQRKIKEIYDVEIDTRTIRRNINLLKYKLDYDISTREDNGKGYYINRDPETDFEPGEIRAIIDNFSYANYIVPSVAKEIIKKCKNMQTVYENEKITIKKTKPQIKNFAESTVEMFGGKKEEIEAICNRCLVNTVFDIFGKNVTIEKIPGNDENFKLVVDSNPMGFRMWAMRNIDMVEVIRPESLRNERYCTKSNEKI